MNWRQALLELLVVFIGVTAAFMLDNYRENQRARELERNYIASLSSDMDADIVQLNELIDLTQQNIALIIRLDQHLASATFPVDSLAIYFVSLATLSRFMPQEIAYQSLTTSGDMKVLTDYDLRRQISGVYSFHEQVKKADDVYENFINNYIFPFVWQQVSLRDMRLRDEEWLKSVEFSNIVQGYIQAASQQLNAYRTCLEKCQSLLTLLQETEKSANGSGTT